MATPTAADRRAHRARLLASVERFRAVIPPLHPARHKGQAGQVAVVGGSDAFVGAPCFAAGAALRAGADLCAVAARGSAAVALKTLLPDAVVTRVGGDAESQPRTGTATATATATEAQVEAVLARAAAVVLGPGLGRDDAARAVAAAALRCMPDRAALVVDADALWFVATDAQFRALLARRARYARARGWAAPVLTPNAAELRRLADGAGVDVDTDADADAGVEGSGVARVVSAALGGVCVVQKGAVDGVHVCADGDREADGEDDGVGDVLVDWRSARCRCGGLGDVLAGVAGTFGAWAQPHGSGAGRDAAAAAAVVAREAAARAFNEHGRGMTASDVAPHVARVVAELEIGELLRDGVRADEEWLALLNE